MWASFRKRPLAAEFLERRALLAGDVTVDVINGNLFIQGDEDDNSISIAAGAEEGSYLVTGLATAAGDTTINGGPDTTLEVSDVTGDIVVRLRDGADTFAAGALAVADDLRISMGDGDDTVNLTAGLSVGGRMQIDTDGGDDSVTATGVALEHSAQVDTGNGDDTVSLTDISVGETEEEAMALNSSNGRDNFGPFGPFGGFLQNLFNNGNDRAFGRGGSHGRGSSDGSVQVDLGTGDDSLTIAGLAAVSFKLAAGNGDDTATLGGLAVDRIYADMGRGDDSLAINETAAERVTALLGDGDDELSLAVSATISDSLYMDAGRGTDNLVDDLAGSGPLDLVRRGFESIS